ncbi:F-box/LRR-repeat protein At4g14103-like [Herrania umbratica]|uniref:F-box/LRR-repeat protein At4g14103-like n=1 Tax=Herrania umbratica TaxID=108875 RepID=A0A6J1ANX4_9ROSI|nr:F-box/LRR-repeat protein At4g14103-like [Herrania umbratica]
MATSCPLEYSERDRLSNLPDDLLCRIISYLPLRETIRASILSRRWKNLFTSMSRLNIDDKLEPAKRCRYGLKQVVDRVLFARQGDVEKFHLKFAIGMGPSPVDGWIQYALWHNVRELELELQLPFSMEIFYVLPDGVLTCKTLVTLKLQARYLVFPKIPGKICLPGLKILYLELIEFTDDDSVQRLFSSCSRLEELVVQNCKLKNISKFEVSNPTLKRLTISYPEVYEYKHEVVINAPSLVYFKCYHFVARYYSYIDLQSLVGAYINCGPVLNSEFYDSGTADLIRGISRVQSLHLSGPLSVVLLLGRGPIPVLKNLTYLKINRCYHEGWERLLDYAPFLETLVFALEVLPDFTESIMNPPKDVPPCLLSHIKAIEFLSFRGLESEVEAAKYFLKHAQVLENLIIQMIAEQKWQLKITEELLESPRASKKCQVVIV